MYRRICCLEYEDWVKALQRVGLRISNDALAAKVASLLLARDIRYHFRIKPHVRLDYEFVRGEEGKPGWEIVFKVVE